MTLVHEDRANKRLDRLYQLSNIWIDNNQLVQLEVLYRDSNDFVTYLHGDELSFEKCMRCWKL